MDSRHDAALDADGGEEGGDDGREAVCGAAGGGDDVVNGGVVEGVVDAVDDVKSVAAVAGLLHGRRDEDLLHALGEVALEEICCGDEFAGAF